MTYTVRFRPVKHWLPCRARKDFGGLSGVRPLFGSGAVLPLLVGVLQGLGSLGSTSISELKTLAVYGIVNPEPQTLNPQPNHPLKTHSI